MNRRTFLYVSAASFLLLPYQLLAAVWNKKAFHATTTDDASETLAMLDEIPSDAIDITSPDRAENGAIVQVAVHSHIPNTEAIAIFVDKNPTALIGNYLFLSGALPNMITRIKMAETSDIKVIVKAGQQYFTASKPVQVLENGCGGSDTVDEHFKSSMKIRARMVKGSNQVQVKAIITHPMHTGLGKDARGEVIPAFFIQLISIRHNDQSAVDMQLGTGIAKNPYLTFYLSEGKPGDRVTVEWHDNQGNMGQSETKVIA